MALLDYLKIGAKTRALGVERLELSIKLLVLKRARVRRASEQPSSHVRYIADYVRVVVAEALRLLSKNDVLRVESNAQPVDAGVEWRGTFGRRQRFDACSFDATRRRLCCCNCKLKFHSKKKNKSLAPLLIAGAESRAASAEVVVTPSATAGAANAVFGAAVGSDEAIGLFDAALDVVVAASNKLRTVEDAAALLLIVGAAAAIVVDGVVVTIEAMAAVVVGAVVVGAVVAAGAKLNEPTPPVVVVVVVDLGGVKLNDMPPLVAAVVVVTAVAVVIVVVGVAASGDVEGANLNAMPLVVGCVAAAGAVGAKLNAMLLVAVAAVVVIGVGAAAAAVCELNLKAMPPLPPDFVVVDDEPPANNLHSTSNSRRSYPQTVSTRSVAAEQN